ncbi:unnamed protein product [Caenorhabditis brenneri]
MASEESKFSEKELEGTFALLFLLLLIGFAIKEFVRIFGNLRAEQFAVRIFDLAFMARDDQEVPQMGRGVPHPDPTEQEILEYQEWVRRRM